MTMKLFRFFASIIICLLVSSGVSLAFDVSGSILNGTINSSSKVYVVVMYTGQSNSTGFGTTIASIPAGGTANFTIRGVPAGNYQIAAFMDILDSGALHVSDPFALGSSFSVIGSNVTIPQLALPAIPSALSAPSAPTNVNVVTTNIGALLVWDSGSTTVGGAGGPSAEQADSYTVFWGANPNPGNGSAFSGSKLISASGGNYHPFIGGLTPGSSLFFTVKATNSGGSTYTSVGPVTIAAATGGATVTGRVYSQGIVKSASTPLYIAIQGQSPGGNFYITGAPIPADTQTWTITGVQPDTYNLYVILDMANDGFSKPYGYITSAGVGNGSANSPIFTVPTEVGTANAPDVTLVAANGTAEVTTMKNNANVSIGLQVTPGTKRPISAIVNSGANLSRPIDLGISIGNGNSSPRFGNNNNLVSLAALPAVGDAYSVSVAYMDGSSETLSPRVTGVVTASPYQTYPLGTTATVTTGTTPFAWRMPLLSAGYYDYSISVNTNSPSFGQIWAPQNRSNGNIPANQLSVPYNFDGSSSSASLTSGSYNWSLSVRDQFGNQNISSTSFSPTAGGPTISGFTPTSGGGAGTPVVINGNGFTGTTKVAFGGVDAPGFVVNNNSQISVSVPSGAPVGPILVTVAGVTAASPTSFPVTATFTSGATTFGGTAIPNATVSIVNANPPVSTSTNGAGNFSITVPSGVPLALQIHDGVHHDTLTQFISFTDNSVSASNYTLFSNADISPFNVDTKGLIYTRVRDWVTNSPQVGFTVTANSYLHPNTPYTVYYSNPAGIGAPVTGPGTSTFTDGKFFVPNLDEGDIVSVTAAKTGYFSRTNDFVSHIDVVNGGSLKVTPLPALNATPAGGTILASQTVTLSITNLINGDSYEVWYTTDGSDPQSPNAARLLYSAPLTLNTGAVTLRFFALNVTKGVAGATDSASYTVITAPGAPQNVTATAGNGQSLVTFLPPSSNGNSSITSYTVTSSPPGGIDQQAGTAALSHTITGLTNSTAYTFVVSATNAAGTGPSAQSTNYYALGVAVSGTGSGNVNSNPVGIICPGGNCLITLAATSPISLFQSASNGSQFSGWSGACNGTGTCSLVLNSLYQSVTAAFDIISDVRLFGSNQPYGLLYPAYLAAAPSGSKIQAKAVTLIENPSFDAVKSISILGGFDATFSNQTGFTTIQGIVTVNLGDVQADRIIIK